MTKQEYAEVRKLLALTEHWLELAREIVLDINGWRNNSKKRFNTRPQPWDGEIRDAKFSLTAPTVGLTTYILANFPKLDPTPLQVIHDAAHVWNIEKSAEHILSAASLDRELEKAAMLVASLQGLLLARAKRLEKQIEIDQGTAPPHTELPASPLPSGGRRATLTELRVEERSLEIYWSGKLLPINQHADFRVFKSLWAERPNVVPYHDLQRAIKPKEFSNAIDKQILAPPDVKDAVSHINAAFRQLKAPFKVKNVRRTGYQLLSDE